MQMELRDRFGISDTRMVNFMDNYLRECQEKLATFQYRTPDANEDTDKVLSNLSWLWNVLDLLVASVPPDRRHDGVKDWKSKLSELLLKYRIRRGFLFVRD